jgi:hypothetical protein
LGDSDARPRPTTACPPRGLSWCRSHRDGWAQPQTSIKSESESEGEGESERKKRKRRKTIKEPEKAAVPPQPDVGRLDAAAADHRADSSPATREAELERRGLVWRDNSYSSQHQGVSWNKQRANWQAHIKHGGKNERLGHFATEEEAKARYDTRCRELGMDRVISDFHPSEAAKTVEPRYR